MTYLEHRNKLICKLPLHCSEGIHLQAISLLTGEQLDLIRERHMSLQAREIGIPACRDSSIQSLLLGQIPLDSHDPFKCSLKSGAVVHSFSKTCNLLHKVKTIYYKTKHSLLPSEITRVLRGALQNLSAVPLSCQCREHPDKLPRPPLCHGHPGLRQSRHYLVALTHLEQDVLHQLLAARLLVDPFSCILAAGRRKKEMPVSNVQLVNEPEETETRTFAIRFTVCGKQQDRDNLPWNPSIKVTRWSAVASQLLALSIVRVCSFFSNPKRLRQSAVTCARYKPV